MERSGRGLYESTIPSLAAGGPEENHEDFSQDS
jgi:hypothetical protein